MNKKGSAEVIAGVSVVVLIVLLITALMSFSYVGVGHVGVKNRLGVVASDYLNPGVYLVGPLTSVEKFDTRVQLTEYKASAASKDLQIVSTNIALNYRVDPTKAVEIYKTIGVDYSDIIITPAIQEVVKAATAHYNAEELVTNREKVKNEITDTITQKLRDKGLEVTQVAITNFDFSAEFNAAIEQKQVAQQAALTAENKLKEMQYTSQAMELQSKVIEIKKLDIQREWIAKWNGILPSQLISSGDTVDMLLSLPTVATK